MALPFFWQQVLKRSTLLDIETTGLDPTRHAPVGAAHSRFGASIQETWFTFETAERTTEGPWYRKFGIKTEEEIENIMEPFAKREWSASWKQARQRWTMGGQQPVPARKYFSKFFARETRAGRFIWTHNVRFDISQFGSQYAHPRAQQMLYEGAHIPGWGKWDPYSGRIFPTQSKAAWQLRKIAYEKPGVAPGAMREWYGAYRRMAKGALKGGEPAVLDSLAIAQSMIGMAQQKGAMARTGDIFTGSSIEALSEAFGVRPKGRAHLATTDVKTMTKILPKLLETTEALYKGKKLKSWQAEALKYLGEAQPQIAQRNIERMFAQAVMEKAETGKFRLQRGTYSTNLDDLVGIYKKHAKHRSYYYEGMLEQTLAGVEAMTEDQLKQTLYDKARVPERGMKGAKFRSIKSGMGARMRKFIAGRNPYLMAGAAAAAAAGVGALLLPNRKEHNTVIGLRHEGMSGFKRRFQTDFGSGYKGKEKEVEKEDEGLGFFGWMMVGQIAMPALALGAVAMRKSKALMTGRTTFLHGRSRATSALMRKEGLMTKYAAGEGSISREMLMKEMGIAEAELEGLVYLTTKPQEAFTYSWQAEFLKKGETVEMAKGKTALKLLNPYFRRSQQYKEGVTKFSIPTWKEEFSKYARENPETARYTRGFSQFWEEVAQPAMKNVIMPEPIQKVMSWQAFRAIEKSAVYARDIGTEWMTASANYNKLTMGEWKQYASLYPGKVAGGAALGAGTVATGIGAADWLFIDDGDGNETKIDGMGHKGMGHHMRRKHTDFGSQYQGVIAISKWAMRFGERATGKYLTQAEAKNLRVYLRQQIKNSQMLRAGKSSFGLEMNDAVMVENIAALKKLQSVRGHKGGVHVLEKEHLLGFKDRAERVREIQKHILHEGFHGAAANQPVLRQKIAEAPIPQNVINTLRMEGYGQTGAALDVMESQVAREAMLKEEAANFLLHPEAAGSEGIRAAVDNVRTKVQGEAWFEELQNLHQSYTQKMPLIQGKAGRIKRNTTRAKMTQDIQKNHAPAGIRGVRLDDSPGVPGMTIRMHNNKKFSKQMYQR